MEIREVEKHEKTFCMNWKQWTEIKKADDISLLFLFFLLSEEDAKALRSFQGGLLQFQPVLDDWDLLPEDKSDECLIGPNKFCFHAGRYCINSANVVQEPIKQDSNSSV